jgi:hypothetical protein
MCFAQLMSIVYVYCTVFNNTIIAVFIKIIVTVTVTATIALCAFFGLG